MSFYHEGGWLTLEKTLTLFPVLIIKFHHGGQCNVTFQFEWLYAYGLWGIFFQFVTLRLCCNWQTDMRQKHMTVSSSLTKRIGWIFKT